MTLFVLLIFATCRIVHNSAPSTPPELIVPSLDSLESQLSNDTRISSGGVDHPKLRFGFTKIENVTCENFLVFGPKLGHRDMSNILRRHFKINYIICRRNIERRVHKYQQQTLMTSQFLHWDLCGLGAINLNDHQNEMIISRKKSTTPPPPF